ncbi:MAG TPA: MBL fold metallo-hydrolase [Xanthobacteraceae bacterium]|jgi:ribonuclease BN (tRNA processing enzyme)
MHLQFIGCGDAFGSGGRHTTCMHVVGESANFLIDCGASSLVALERLGVVRDAIDTILITHFHGDHFGGVPYFVLAAHFGKRQRPLTLAGPPGIESWYVRALEAAFEKFSEIRLAFDLRIVSLPERTTTAIGSLQVTPFPVVHGNSGGPFYGYRIETEGRTVAYSGDTQWTDTLIEVGRDADLFVMECYSYDKPIGNHLSLKTIEQNLARINPKKLVLTHMSHDMLAQRHKVAHLTAADGMVVAL